MCVENQSLQWGRQMVGHGGRFSAIQVCCPALGVRPFSPDDLIDTFGASMTTPDHTPAPEAVATEEATDKKSAIPAFSFPFKPGELLQAKTKDSLYYKKNGKSDHTKIPGAAPHGTRKSMGKR
jgi:hypothetical protein